MEHASAQHRAAAADASAAALNVTKVAGARFTCAYARSSRSVRTTLAGCAADAKDGLRRWGGECAHKGWGEPANTDARHAPLERGRMERAGEAAAGSAGRPERSADVMCVRRASARRLAADRRIRRQLSSGKGSLRRSVSLWAGRAHRATVHRTFRM